MTENQNREYKQSWHDDYMKWVCGFANSICGMQVVLYKDATPQVTDPVEKSGAESGAESGMRSRILKFLEFQILSKIDISRKQGKEKPSGYLNNLVKEMVVEGLIEYTIPDKPNSRLQKYRITDKGLKYLKDRK